MVLKKIRKLKKEFFTRKIYLVNTITSLFFIVSFAIFDFSLNLGSFHGLVFSIFLLYSAAGLFLFNIIAGIIMYIRKNKKAIPFFISSVSFPLILAGIAYIFSRLTTPFLELINSTIIPNLLSYEFMGLRVSSLVISVGIFIAIFLLLQFLKYTILGALKRLTKRTPTEYDELLIDIIENMGWFIYMVVSLYVAIFFLDVPHHIMRPINYAVLVIILIHIIPIVIKTFRFSKQLINKRKRLVGK